LKGRQNVTEAELREEAGWIFNQQVTTFNNSAEIDVLKQKIFRVLELVHLKKLDLPLIARYYMDELHPQLDEEKVWQIFNLDLEFGKFVNEREKVQEFFRRLKPRVENQTYI